MAKKAFHTPFLGRIGKIPAPRPPFRSIFLAKDAKSAKKPPKRPKLLGKLGALCKRNSSARMPDNGQFMFLRRVGDVQMAASTKSTANPCSSRSLFRDFRSGGRKNRKNGLKIAIFGSQSPPIRFSGRLCLWCDKVLQKFPNLWPYPPPPPALSD